MFVTLMRNTIGKPTRKRPRNTRRKRRIMEEYAVPRMRQKGLLDVAGRPSICCDRASTFRFGVGSGYRSLTDRLSPSPGGRDGFRTSTGVVIYKISPRC